MNTTLAVQVTQEDIDQGKRADCLKCPVALAVRRAMKNRGYDPTDIKTFGNIFLRRIKDKIDLSLSEYNQDASTFASLFDAAKSETGILPQPTEFLFFLA